MSKFYNVYSIVECSGMVNNGKVSKLNATPMTHKEACNFMNKLTKRHWSRYFLAEDVAKLIVKTV